MAPVNPLMSLRAYAKRRGVSAMAVSNAVKTGRLVASVGRDQWNQPKISDPDLADQEWDRNTDLTKAPPYVKDRAAARAAAEPIEAPAKIVRPPAEMAGPGNVSAADASAEAKYWDARLKELKYREAAAELIPARDVERRMISTFTECKAKLLTIPSRAKQALPHLTLGDLASIDALVREALESLATEVAT